MFEKLEPAPADPILGLAEAFLLDPNPAKINLSVGVYKDAEGKTPVLSSVKQAEQRLLAEESTKGYLPIDGAADYSQAIGRLLFGADHEALAQGRVIVSHTPGGTGALRVAADFIHQMFPQATVWLSQPTWPNHPAIFEAAGVPTKTYPYFDADTNALAFDAMIAALENAPAGDVVLLHGCCHNPTGIDPSPDEWLKIAEVVHARRLLPLVDLAYQGFAEGLCADAAAVEVFSAPESEMIVCSSLSKNFSLYRERVGTLTVLAKNAEQAATVQSQIKRTIRANYSNPPAHGAAIAATILGDAALRSSWEAELAAMRDRINGMRRLFAETLAAKNAPRDFSFISQQRGMFSFSGLTPGQVERLRSEHAIYIVGSGRINVAGMTEANMDPLCEAIVSVLT